MITNAQSAGPGSPDPLASGARHGSPDPLASGASFASPDPSWAQAPTSDRPSPRLGARLPTHGARTHDVTDAVTPIPRQDMEATIPTTPATVALPLLLCYLTSFTMMYRLTVKEVWGRLTSVTIGYLLQLLQDMQ